MWPVLAIAAFVVVGTYIAKWIKDNWEDIKKFFENIWNKLVEIFSPVAQWIWDNVVSPIIEFFKPIVEAIWNIVKEIWKNLSEIVIGVAKAVWSIITKIAEIFAKIVEIFVAIGKAFYTYVVKPIWNDFIVPLFSWIYDKAIKPIINLFVNVGSWVYNHIISPIIDKIKWLKNKAVEIFQTIGIAVVDFIGGSVKSVINGVLSLIQTTINGFIRMLNGAIGIINEIPGVSITRVNLLNIPRLQGGGFPQGEDGLFYANHKEMVGKFSNGKTAVANNDQIVEGIQSGVFNAMMSALRNTELGNGDIVIEATGDTEGLLSFISFKQKQKDRQFN